MKRLAALGAFAALLAACARPKPWVIVPRYQAADFNGREVRLFPLYDLRIDNEEDFREELVTRYADGKPVTAKTEAVLGRSFYRQLEELADNVKTAHDSTLSIETTARREIQLELPGEEGPVPTAYSFPPARLLADSGRTADLGLHIMRLRFRRIRDALGVSALSDAANAGSRGPRALQLQGKYLLWDYRADAPVAYGRFTTETFFTSSPEPSDWDAVVREAVKDIVSHSPMKGPKVIAATTPRESGCIEKKPRPCDRSFRFEEYPR